ncbi:hypothetical protein D3C72_2204200 [compost metagenome]
MHKPSKIKLSSKVISPKVKLLAAVRSLAKNCTKAEISKILEIAAPLIKGPCQGIKSLTKEGDSDANKLNAPKAQNAVKPAIKNKALC